VWKEAKIVSLKLLSLHPSAEAVVSLKLCALQQTREMFVLPASFQPISALE
jgi:hypothetical protein